LLKKAHTGQTFSPNIYATDDKQDRLNTIYRMISATGYTMGYVKNRKK